MKLSVEHLSVMADGFSLRDITFAVEEGDYFVLLGASGSGKTVLLETLAGFRSPDEGQILLDGKEVSRRPIQQRNMAMVFQNSTLFPHLTVHENIAYGLKAKGRDALDIASRVLSLAEETGVVKLLRRAPATLSGGEVQRVALARALATEPDCLLLDEPLSALDTHARHDFRQLLRNIHRKGQTVIHLTHDYEEALALATRVAIIEKHGLTQIGEPQEVFQHPDSEFLARFVGIRNVYSGTLSRAENSSTGIFTTNGVTLSVLTEEPEGSGFFLLRSEDVTLSLHAPDSSARNSFEGVVRDIIPVRLGVEIVLDIGIEIVALLTQDTVNAFNLTPGANAWVSFKASAGRVIQGE